MEKACGAVARRLVVDLYHVNLKTELFSYFQYQFYKISNVPDILIDDMNLGNRFTSSIRKFSLNISQQLVKLISMTIQVRKGVEI